MFESRRQLKNRIRKGILCEKSYGWKVSKQYPDTGDWEEYM